MQHPGPLLTHTRWPSYLVSLPQLISEQNTQPTWKMTSSLSFVSDYITFSVMARSTEANIRPKREGIVKRSRRAWRANRGHPVCMAVYIKVREYQRWNGILGKKRPKRANLTP